MHRSVVHSGVQSWMCQPVRNEARRTLSPRAPMARTYGDGRPAVGVVSKTIRAWRSVESVIVTLSGVMLCAPMALAR